MVHLAQYLEKAAYPPNEKETETYQSLPISQAVGPPISAPMIAQGSRSIQWGYSWCKPKSFRSGEHQTLSIQHAALPAGSHTIVSCVLDGALEEGHTARSAAVNTR